MGCAPVRYSHQLISPPPSALLCVQVGDLRRAVAELGKERDKLLEEKRARERAAQHAAAAVAAAKRWGPGMTS